MSLKDIIARILNLIIVVPAIVIMSPLMALISLAIKLDSPGPVMYFRIVVGKNRKLFKQYKFRTMRIDADDILNTYVNKLVSNPGMSKTDWYIRNDPRISNFGAFLRRSSLDELPQLINVLEGNMNLVGPRARMPFEIEKYPEELLGILLQVPPGLTGLWQVSREPYYLNNMIDLDLEYIRKRSVLLDLAIMLKTVWVVFQYKGAY